MDLGWVVWHAACKTYAKRMQNTHSLFQRAVAGGTAVSGLFQRAVAGGTAVSGVECVAVRLPLGPRPWRPAAGAAHCRLYICVHRPDESQKSEPHSRMYVCGCALSLPLSPAHSSSRTDESFAHLEHFSICALVYVWSGHALLKAPTSPWGPNMFGVMLMGWGVPSCQPSGPSSNLSQGRVLPPVSGHVPLRT